MKQDYTYAVARIRSRELKLLSQKDIEALMSLKTYDECMDYLIDKGYGDDDGDRDERTVLAQERRRLWELISELVPDLSVFDVFRCADDFQNLKISIKAVTRDVEPMLLQNGSVSGEKIYHCVKGQDYSSLPDYLRQAAQPAFTALLQTGDGQSCDLIIDSAYLNTLYELAERSDCEVIKLYSELTIASADILAAVRCERIGKKHGFIIRALAPCNTINIELLARAAAKSFDDILSYLSTTEYALAAEELKISISAFERWRDNYLIDKIKPQKYQPFTISPISAYIIAKENELKVVRLILTAKQNGFDPKVVSERLRDMYV